MTPSHASSPGPDPDLRPGMRDDLIARVRRGTPLLLSGPPGAGKTTLLRRVADQLAQDGWLAVYLDLMGAASCPEGLVRSALDALPAGSFGESLAQATAIRRLAASGREHGAAAVEALFALWARLGESGRPVVLLLDEATEIRSLAYFKGLRHVERPFVQCLAARSRATLLATSYPSLAGRLWPSLERLALPAVTAAQLSGVLPELGLDAARLARASFGWPRYVAALLPALRRGVPVATAWAESMQPGGLVETQCRHTYETLLLRSKGYGMSKAVLAAVATHEGANLTALVARLGRTPGAVRDYLGWLLDVDAIETTRKRYSFVDGMLRQWILLHARGGAVRSEEVALAARELVEATRAADAGRPGLEDEAPPAIPPRPARVDSLIEID